MQSGCDLLGIRHPLVGAAAKTAEICTRAPVINFGDGKGKHPTQGFVDLGTVRLLKKRLHGLQGLIIGDALNGRTVHSLLDGLSLFPENRVVILAPKELWLTESMVAEYQRCHLWIEQISSVEELEQRRRAGVKFDFTYGLRAQFERRGISETKKVEYIIITPEILDIIGEDVPFLHPMPIAGEVSPEVDDDPRAKYITEQLPMSYCVRMALFGLVLDRIPQQWF